MHNTLLAVLIALMVVVAVDSFLFFEHHLPSTTRSAPQTTMDSGPSFASATYNGDPSFSFSSSEPNSTFECKLDSGSWVSCTSPKSYSGLANGEHTFSVRAIDRAGNADASPEIRRWRVWGCSGKQIVPGDDLDAIVNADSSTVETTFCIHAGTYAIDQTVNVRTGDKLLGEEGTTTKIGPATYPTNPPVKITNGTNLPRLVHAQGENVTLKWLDVSGARSLHNADGSYDTGTGVAIGAGQADHTSLIQWVVGHDNEGNAFGGTSGKILNVECFNNATDPVSLGWQGSCSKSHKEHEFAYSYIHDDFGNGIWCDAGCLNIPQQANGFWPHHNLIAGEGRFGIRYEHSPAYLDPGVYVPDAPATQPNATIEHNELHDNAYGGFAMHDAQNGVVRNNSFGAVTLEGISFAGNGDGGKAGQFSDGGWAHRTDLYNGEAYGNTLRGEYIQGCSKPDEIVSCF
jgi:parallel beta-helix repeat protein